MAPYDITHECLPCFNTDRRHWYRLQAPASYLKTDSHFWLNRIWRSSPLPNTSRPCSGPCQCQTMSDCFTNYTSWLWMHEKHNNCGHSRVPFWEQCGFSFLGLMCVFFQANPSKRRWRVKRDENEKNFWITKTGWGPTQGQSKQKLACNRIYGSVWYCVFFFQKLILF